MSNMSVKSIAGVAESKGYFVGRSKPGKYYYGYSDGVSIFEHVFIGGWADFAKLIQSLPSVSVK